jgi:lysophospholipase L1-like esterase
MFKKLILPFVIICSIFTACSETKEPAVSTASTASANEPTTSVIEDEQTMYSHALLSEGDLTRLASKQKLAAAGQPLSVAVIGGSITQGSAASNYTECYAELFHNWWLNKYPDSEITFTNAGIGGTDSYLGVHRADEQLLKAKPDVVIVEFSVNDTDKVMNKFSYDSLVRKILSQDNNPAVILLFMTQDNGTSLQDVHKQIGEAYNLPMISYHDAVMWAMEQNTLKWEDISPDNIHPNSAGHAIIGELLTEFLDNADSKESDFTAEPGAFTTPAYTSDYYKNAHFLNADGFEAEATGFEKASTPLYPQFGNGYKTTAGGSLKFTVTTRNFGLFYLCTTDGKSGTYEVYIDGERKGLINADFTGGWGNYGATKQFLLANESASHTIEIKPLAGNEDKGITILALMVS